MTPVTLTFSAEASRSQISGARVNCKIEPVVMIFDSKPRELRPKHAKDRKMPSGAASAKTFAFVNTSQPGKTDEESRRLVKTHVMQDVLRRKSGGCSKQETRFFPGLCLSQDSPQCAGNSPRAPPSCFLIFPIQTEAYMLKLIHDCA
jgi:hypothetical protein